MTASWPPNGCASRSAENPSRGRADSTPGRCRWPVTHSGRGASASTPERRGRLGPGRGPRPSRRGSLRLGRQLDRRPARRSPRKRTPLPLRSYLTRVADPYPGLQTPWTGLASSSAVPISPPLTAVRLIPLWMASGGGVWSGLSDDLVDLAGDVAFQSPESSWESCSSLSGGVPGGVVGGGLLPAGPDDPEPGTGDDAGGVWVALAAGAGVGVQAPGPGRGQP